MCESAESRFNRVMNALDTIAAYVRANAQSNSDDEYREQMANIAVLRAAASKYIEETE